MGEEADRRRELEITLQRERMAKIAIFQVPQKLQHATPENLESLKEELLAVLNSSLPALGSQEGVVKIEVAKVLERTQERVAQMKVLELQKAAVKDLEEKNKKVEQL